MVRCRHHWHRHPGLLRASVLHPLHARRGPKRSKQACFCSHFGCKGLQSSDFARDGVGIPPTSVCSGIPSMVCRASRTLHWGCCSSQCSRSAPSPAHTTTTPLAWRQGQSIVRTGVTRTRVPLRRVLAGQFQPQSASWDVTASGGLLHAPAERCDILRRCTQPRQLQRVALAGQVSATQPPALGL